MEVKELRGIVRMFFIVEKFALYDPIQIDMFCFVGRLFR
jgi:hypothetical protein